MGAGAEGYKVMIKATEKVTPVSPVQEHRLPQSNFDLQIPAIDVSIFFCFTRPLTDVQAGPAMVSVLKEALSKVLVSYYPLAGEVVANSSGEPEICCNNRGVNFIEAYADVALKELNLYDADASVEGRLVPRRKDSIVCAQVTELRCGGMVLGCTFDHRVSDAHSINMFMSAWAATARCQPVSCFPSFRRSLLSSRSLSPSTPRDPIFDCYMTRFSNLPASHSDPDSDLVNRIYYVSAADITRLQEIIDHNYSKMVCFTAYMWQILARSANHDEKSCSMGLVVNGRSRIQIPEDEKAMEGYFGNVISVPYGNLGVETLLDMKLGDVAAEVDNWLSPTLSEIHFLGLMDWIEAHRPEPVIPKIYLGEDDSVSCVISGGRGFPEVDFGQGKTVFGSYHFPWGEKAGYMMPIPQPTTGDWVVYAHVAPSVVKVMEEEPTIFRPLTTEYFLGVQVGK